MIGIGIGLNKFRSRGGILLPTPSLLLDTYPGAAAAYSLRGLSTEYVNSLNPYAATVRNGAGDHANIGFVFNSLTGDYDLDTVALLAHCDGSNGFVSDWYDQSGNARNAIQLTSENQPQIVSSGSVILENGKPSVEFDGINDSIGIYSSMPATIFNTEFTSFSVGLANDNNSEQRLFSLSIGQYYFFIQRMFTNTNFITSYANAPSAIQNEIAYTNWGQTVLYYNKVVANDTSDTAINAGLILSKATGAFNGVSTAGWSFGSSRNAAGSYLDGKIQELVFYNSDQSSNRTGIETNINDFYSIY